MSKPLPKIPLDQKLQLTVREACAYCNIGEMKLRKMIQTGEFNKVITVGARKQYLLNRKALEEYFWGKDDNET